MLYDNIVWASKVFGDFSRMYAELALADVAEQYVFLLQILYNDY